MTSQSDVNTTTSSSKEQAAQAPYVAIVQGSAGVLDAERAKVGLYTDKIATCRPYVFVCKDATIMVHDTGQIRMDELSALITKYGKIRAVHFVEGKEAQEGLHQQRLLQLAKVLQFKRAVHRPVPAYVSLYGAVTFTQSGGLRIQKLSENQLHRDPNEAQREATNRLNDLFTPPRSRTAPLDVQYVDGNFTPPPTLSKDLVEMFRDAIVDGNEQATNGLIDISALYMFMPVAVPGIHLPPAFIDFVKEYELESLVDKPFKFPRWYADPAAQLQVMEKFKALPIFGT